MVLSGMSYLGPDLPAHSPLYRRMPQPLLDLLAEVNGFVAFRGGLHVRGVAVLPSWHSLERVWTGAFALNRLFGCIRATDVPFGEDGLGDQFILRDGEVCRLHVEADRLEPFGVDLQTWLEAVRCDPFEFLDLEPLRRFQAQGHILRPGRVLVGDQTLPALEALVQRARRAAVARAPQARPAAFASPAA